MYFGENRARPTEARLDRPDRRPGAGRGGAGGEEGGKGTDSANNTTTSTMTSSSSAMSTSDKEAAAKLAFDPSSPIVREHAVSETTNQSYGPASAWSSRCLQQHQVRNRI